jgi:hypothetical protein
VDLKKAAGAVSESGFQMAPTGIQALSSGSRTLRKASRALRLTWLTGIQVWLPDQSQILQFLRFGAALESLFF